MKWEYREVVKAFAKGQQVLWSINDELIRPFILWHDFARQAGQEGWELVTVVDSSGSTVFFFKRPC